MIKNMGKEYSIAMIEVDMRETMLMVKNMEKEYTVTIMGIDMRETM